MDMFPLELSHLDPYPELKAKVDASLNYIEQTFERWQPQEVGFSFNGGKDSVALAALVLHAVRSLQKKSTGTWIGTSSGVGNVRTIFFRMENEYPEILAFMRQFAATFQLNVIELACGFKEGLHKLVAPDPASEILPMKAMFLGTRRDDPDGQDQLVFSPTDPSWPPLTRVNPILYFTYHDIWQFIRIYNLPYCLLYNKGFTSIGTTDDTIPNPVLWNPVLHTYAPPWKLPSGSFERSGRGCRRFLRRNQLSSLLAYPGNLISTIVQYISFSELVKLYMCGAADLNLKIEHAVRIITKVPLIANNNTPKSVYFLQRLKGIVELDMRVHPITNIEHIIRLPCALSSLSIQVIPRPSDVSISKLANSDELGSSNTNIDLINKFIQVHPLRHLSLDAELFTKQTLIACPTVEHLRLNGPIRRMIEFPTRILSRLELGCITNTDMIPVLPDALMHLSIGAIASGSISKLWTKLPAGLRVLSIHCIGPLEAFDINFFDSLQSLIITSEEETSVDVQIIDHLLPQTLTRLSLDPCFKINWENIDLSRADNLKILDARYYVRRENQLAQLSSRLISLHINFNDNFIRWFGEQLPNKLTRLNLDWMPGNEWKLLPRTLLDLNIGRCVYGTETTLDATTERDWQDMPPNLRTLEIVQKVPIVLILPNLPPSLLTLSLNTSNENFEERLIPMLPRFLRHLTLHGMAGTCRVDLLARLPPYLVTIALPCVTLELHSNDKDIEAVLPIWVELLQVKNATMRIPASHVKS